MTEITLEMVQDLGRSIETLKKAAEEVARKGAPIEAVKRNTKRILASVKMLELNICDLEE